MTERSCRACATVRAYIDLTSADHADDHVCSGVDVDMIELLPRYLPGAVYLDEARAINRRVLINWGAAQTFAEISAFPKNGDEFLHFLEAIHRRLFDGTSLAFAGRFRRGEEHSAPFGPWGRQLPTSPASDIRTRLATLFRRRLGLSASGPQSYPTKQALARTCAHVLHDFFAIHPFVDGNGRTGRLLLISIAAARSGFRFRTLDERNDPNRTASYIDALQSVDQNIDYLDRYGAGPGEAVSAYAPLERWLLDLLIDDGSLDVDEEPNR